MFNMPTSIHHPTIYSVPPIPGVRSSSSSNKHKSVLLDHSESSSTTSSAQFLNSSFDTFQSSNSNPNNSGLKRVDSNSTIVSNETHLDSTSISDNNYKLVKMASRNSVDSSYNSKIRYKIELHFNRQQIELIRYSWNKVLLDEPLINDKKNLKGNNNINTNDTSNSSNNNNNNNNYFNFTNTSTVASSLFCRQFYGNLLSKDENLEKMFPSIKHQAIAFAGVMSMAISQLENLDAMQLYLIKLGKRHARILNIEGCHFELMGEALIQTFQERFGIHFTQELEILWIKLYLYLSNSILQFGMDPVLKLSPYEMEESREETESVGEGKSLSSFSFLRRSTTESSIASKDTSVNSINLSKPNLPSNDSAENISLLNGLGSIKPPPGKEHKRRTYFAKLVSTTSRHENDPPTNINTTVKSKKKDCVIM
ncbi:globin-like protein [Scheffersomyces coipomensis]|uniref:globin-like protein n=1 Tax=Scheffersomyces coipomensis TaxID=1788519 RepID=UPI00315CBE53